MRAVEWVNIGRKDHFRDISPKFIAPGRTSILLILKGWKNMHLSRTSQNQNQMQCQWRMFRCVQSPVFGGNNAILFASIACGPAFKSLASLVTEGVQNATLISKNGFDAQACIQLMIPDAN